MAPRFGQMEREEYCREKSRIVKYTEQIVADLSPEKGCANGFVGSSTCVSIRLFCLTSSSLKGKQRFRVFGHRSDLLNDSREGCASRHS